MTQMYTDPRALLRLDRGQCPECGYPAESHGGWGGPWGCSLTDNGVAQRVYDHWCEAESSMGPGAT